MAGATAIVAVVGAIVFGSVVTNPTSHVLSGFTDAAMTMRAYDIIDQAGSTPFTFSRDPFNGAPEGYPMLPSAQIAAPIQPAFVWLSKDALGIVGAVNTFLLIGLLLTGVAMFALLDRCGVGFLPGVFAALLVTFNPWMVERAASGHVAFAHGWVLILLLFTLLRLREKRTVTRAAVAGATYGLCFLMASYSGLLATALVTGFALLDFVTAGTRVERLWTLTLLTTIGATTAIFLTPGLAVLVMKQEQITASLSRSAAQLQLGGASPLHYILPSPRHPLVGSLAERLRPWDFFHEKTVFFGYTTAVLAALATIALIRRGEPRRGPHADRQRHLARLALAAGPIALVLSFGRSITIAGLDVPMPAYLLGEVTSFYRIYARLGFVVALCLAILAALYLSRLNKRKHGPLIVVGLIALTAVELAPGTVDAIRIDAPPLHDRWLATQSDGIVAHYPMITDQQAAEKLAARELYYQRFTGKPLFEIYGPERRGTREEAIRLLARYVTDPQAPGILAAEGVKYVVVHDDVYRAQRQPTPELGSQFVPLRRFGPVRIYRLRTRPVDLDRVLARNADVVGPLFGIATPRLRIGSGFYGEERYFDYSGKWRWMSQSGKLVLENPNDKVTLARLDGLAFSNKITRRVELVDEGLRVLATASVAPSLGPFQLGPFRLPPGETRLSLLAEPGPAPLGDRKRTGSVYLSPLSVRVLADYGRSLRAR